MKKIILACLCLLFVACSQNSPDVSFKKMQESVCSGNYEEALKFVSIEDFIISQYKKEKNISDDDLNKFKQSDNFKKSIKKAVDSFKKESEKKNNSELCQMQVISSKIEGDRAILLIQEKKFNPYSKFNYIYKKIDSIWKLIDVEDNKYEPILVDVDELYNHYENNIVAADEKYKGKILTVKGKINAISRDITNKLFVILGEGIIGKVQCFILESNEKFVAKIKKGDNITLTGVCNGKVLIVELKDCAFDL